MGTVSGSYVEHTVSGSTRKWRAQMTYGTATSTATTYTIPLSALKMDLSGGSGTTMKCTKGNTHYYLYRVGNNGGGTAVDTITSKTTGYPSSDKTVNGSDDWTMVSSSSVAFTRTTAAYTGKIQWKVQQTSASSWSGTSTAEYSVTIPARPAYTVTATAVTRTAGSSVVSTTGGWTAGSGSVYHGYTATLYANVNTGYVFKGWATSTTATSYVSTSTMYTTPAIGAATTYYAIFEAKTTAVTFNPNGGTLDSSGNWGSDANTSNNHILTCTQGSANYYATGIASRTGYTFAGWNTKNDGTGYTVWDTSGVCTTSGSYWSAAGSSGRWNAAGSTSALTVYATWQEITANLTLNNSGLTDATLPSPNPVTMSYTQATNVPAAASAEGYTFLAWANSLGYARDPSNTTGTFYTPGDTWKAANVVPTDATLYACFYSSVNYDLNYTGAGGSSIAMYYADEHIADSTPSRVGYNFGGWYGNSSGTGTNYANTTIKAANTYTPGIDLFAKWTGVSYSVEFDNNGGSGTMATQTGFVYNTPKALTTNGFTAPPGGYTFKGWATSTTRAAAGMVDYANQANMVTGTTTHNGTVILYAVWERTITFKHGNPNVSPPPTTPQHYGGRIFPPSIETITGWTPLGWRDDTTAGAKEYGANNTNSFAYLGTDTTLYAVYSRAVAISYDAGGGSGTAPANTTATQYYNSYGSISTPSFTTAANTFTAPTNDGNHWNFKQWTDNASATTNRVNAGSTYNSWVPAVNNTTVTKTLYAVWNRNVSFYSGLSKATTTGPAEQEYSAASNVGLRPLTVPSGTATVSGWNISGWRKDTTAAAKEYNATGSITPTWSIAPTSLVLYAVYTRTLTINYANGSTDATGTTPNPTTTTQYYNTNGAITSPTVTLAVNPYTRTGYNFSSWKVSTSNTTVSSGGPYPWSIAVDVTSISRTATAQWAEKTATLTYNASNLSGATVPSAVTMKYTTATTLTAGSCNNYNLAGYADTLAHAYAGTISWTSTQQYKAANVVPTAATIYAVWYSILTYNANGHGTAPGSVTMYYNTGVTGNSGITATGYAFGGWYDNTNLTGTNYAGASVKAPSVYKPHTVLYAKWTPIIQTLTANANGGTISATSGWTVASDGATATKSVNYDAQYGTLPTPTRNGYTFEGWYTAASGGSSVSTTTKMTSTSGATIYAHWTPQTSTVTLNANGGSGGTASVTATYDSAMPTATMPTFSGWTFLGYYDTSATTGGTQYYTNTGASARTWNKTGAQTLYARWSRTITFKHGKASASSDTATQYYGGNVTPPTISAITNWVPVGWRDDTTAGNKEYGANNTTAFAYTGTATTLYAAYSRTLTLSYTNGGGSGTASTSGTATQYYNSYGSVSTVSFTLATNTFTAPSGGYAFSKWGLGNASTSWSWSPGVDDSASTSTAAIWTRTITFKHGKESATTSTATQTYGSNVTPPSITAISGWTPIGWRDDTTAGAKEYGANNTTAFAYTGTAQTLYAAYSRTLTISYAANGGSGTTPSNTTTTQYYNSYNTITSPSVTLATNPYTKTGHNFGGWLVSTSNTTVISGGSYTWSIGVTETTITRTATAQWTAISYTLTIDPNGGTWDNSTSTSTATQNYATTKSIAAPTRTGYTFLGWAETGPGSLAKITQADPAFDTSSGGVGVYNNSGGGTVTHARQASSAGTAYGSYEILISSSSGTTSPGNGGFVQNTGSAANKKYIHTFVAKIPTGYTVQQACNATGNGRTITWLTPRVGTGSFTVYAYQHNCGSSGTFSTFGHVYLDTGSRPVSWQLAYSAMNDITDGTANTYTYGAGNGRITALWVGNKYTVAFNANGGSGSMSNQTDFYYGTAKALTTNGFTAPSGGYSFQGWATSTTRAAAGTVDYANGANMTTGTTTNGGTVTLYAVWKRTVTFKHGKASASSDTATQYYGGNITPPTITGVTGWTPIGWRDDTTAGNKEYGANNTNAFAYTSTAQTLYAAYSRSLTLSYTNGGGSGTAPSNTTSTQYYNSYGATSSASFTLAANTFTAPDGGYAFSKWGAGNASTSWSWNPGVDASASTSTAAVWTRTVTFKHGKANATSTNVTQTYGSNITPPSITTVSGWTALGWRDDTSAGAKEYGANNTTAFAYTATVQTLYAVYSRTLTISYANGSTDATGTKPNNTTTTQYYNANGAITSPSVNLASNPYTRTGYNFSSWLVSTSNTNVLSGGSYTWSIAVDATTTGRTATAQWSEKTATLTYNNGGHGTAPANVTMKYTTATNAAAAITASGYTFTGWKRSDDSTIVAAGAQVKAANVVPSALTLTAQWTTNMTVTPTAYSAAYNGSAHNAKIKVNVAGTTVEYGTSTSYGYSLTATNSNTDYTLSSVSRTNVGTTTVYYRVTKSGYTTVTGSTTITITQRPVTWTAPTAVSDTLTYNGEAKILANVGTASAGGEMYYYVSDNATPPTFNTTDWKTSIDLKTDAKTWYIHYYCYVEDTTNNKNGNTNNTTINTAYTISKAINKAANPISVTATQSISGVNYNVSNQDKSFTAATNAQGAVTYAIQNQKNSGGTAVNYFTIPTNTSASLRTLANTPAGTYTVVVRATAAGNNNYNSGYKDITITVTVTSYTVTMTKGTGIASVTYKLGTGSATTYSSAVTVPVGQTVTYGATASSGYTWWKWTGTHSSTTNAYSFTMTAANVSDTANAMQQITTPTWKGTLTYNKSSQSATATTLWNNYSTTTSTIGGTTSGTNATSYNATFTPKSGYCWSDGTTTAKTVSWSILKKEVTLTWGTTSWTYDGNTHSTTCTAGEVISGDTCTVTLTGNSVGANVGTATVTASSLSNSNYKLPSANTKTISITRASVGAKPTTSVIKVYTGSEQNNGYTTPSNVSMTGNNKGTAVGTYTAKYTPDSNHCWSDNTYAEVTVTLTISNATIVIDAPNQSYTYDGNAHGSAITVTTVGSQTATIKYGTASGTYNLTTAPQITNVADSKTIYYQVTAPNHTTKTGSYTLTINKRTVTPTAPTLTTGTLTYNGSAKTLANVGSCTAGGTMYYYVSTSSTAPTFSTSTWNTSIATQVNAGTYYVYWYCYVSDTANNNDTTTDDINVVRSLSARTINKASISPSVTMSGWTYGGTPTNPSVSGNPGNGAVTYTYKVSGAADSTYTSTKPSTAGTYTVKASVAETSNYLSGTATTNFTIAKRTVTPTAPIINTSTLTYDGNAKTLATAGSCTTGGVMYYYVSTSSTAPTFSTSTWKTSIDTKTDAGTYYIYWYCYVSDTNNNNDTSSDNINVVKSLGSKTINRATMTITPTAYNKDYDGNSHSASIKSSVASTTISYGTSTSYGNTVTVGTSNVSMSSVTRTNPGTTTVYYKATKPNYNDVTGTTTITITGVPVHSKVGGAWKHGIVYVKVSNTWKKATAGYVKVDGTWKPINK